MNEFSLLPKSQLGGNEHTSHNSSVSSTSRISCFKSRLKTLIKKKQFDNLSLPLCDCDVRTHDADVRESLRLLSNSKPLANRQQVKVTVKSPQNGVHKVVRSRVMSVPLYSLQNRQLPHLTRMKPVATTVYSNVCVYCMRIVFVLHVVQRRFGFTLLYGYIHKRDCQARKHKSYFTSSSVA